MVKGLEILGFEGLGLFRVRNSQGFRKRQRLMIGLMDKILHYLKDPKLWELWYIPYNG